MMQIVATFLNITRRQNYNCGFLPIWERHTMTYHAWCVVKDAACVRGDVTKTVIIFDESNSPPTS